MQVNRIATMMLEVARAEEPVIGVAERMKNSEIGFLPVMSHGKVVGVVTDRDLALRVVAMGVDPRKVLTRDVMTHDVFWIYDDAEIENAIRLMAEKAVRRLLVRNHQDEPVGILSLDDLAIFTNGDETTGRVLQRIAAASSSFSAFKAF